MTDACCSMSETDPHDEIERLEAQIDEIESRIRSCDKFILASRIAVVGGAVVFVVMLSGAIRLDPTIMAAAFAAVLGGIAVWGSNGSTAKEAAAELRAAEAHRAALIGEIDLRLVPGRDTLH
jgi:hypothetical protein